MFSLCNIKQISLFNNSEIQKIFELLFKKSSKLKICIEPQTRRKRERESEIEREREKEREIKKVIFFFNLITIIKIN